MTFHNCFYLRITVQLTLRIFVAFAKLHTGTVIMPTQQFILPLRTFVPHPLLQPYISAYRFMSMNTEDATVDVDIFPVDCGSVMAFSLLDMTGDTDRQGLVSARLNFTGQVTRHCPVKACGTFAFVYIIFRPFGAWPFLHIPQHELTDTGVMDLNDILTRRIRDTFARLTEQPWQPQDVIRILEAWMLQQLCHTHDRLQTGQAALAYTCSLICKAKGNMSVKELCRQTGMSKTSVERHFNEKIGVSPKMYSRIIRFSNAYDTICRETPKSWQDIVYTHNYFDQAHFIHEFRHFSGRTPSQHHQSLLNSWMVCRESAGE